MFRDPHHARLQYSVGFVVLLVLIAGCGNRDTQPTTPTTPSLNEESRFRNVADAATEFVGDAVCATCHEQEWSGFQSHGMAHSYYPLTSANVVEHFGGQTITHPGSGLSYRAVKRDTSYFIEEFRIGESGDQEHVLARRIDFVVGSGTAARTYLTVENGRLFELPLTWYTQKSRWDLSPGYITSNGRFSRAIPDRCMACHNSYPVTVPFADGKYTEVPNGIGCERCHGPGALHVDERLVTEEASDELDDSIVNPAHLSIDRQLDVCQQCHLQTTVSMLRDGRGPFDFRPSESLADHVALFAEEKEIAEAESIDVISHADRMKQSECFLQTIETSSPLTCTTCHNPHEGFRTKGPEYFTATCISCHAVDNLTSRLAQSSSLQDHTPIADCASCHMPKVDADDVPHASFTDHWIRTVGQSRLPNVAPIRTGDRQLFAYFERDEDGVEAEIYRGMANVIYAKQRQDSAAFREGISILSKSLSAGSGFGEAYYLLGFAHIAIGETEAAIAPLEESVRLDSGIPERLNSLALAYEATGRSPQKTENLYLKAIGIQPAASDIRINYGRFLETQNRLEDARTQYQLAIEEEPSLAVGHYNMGTVYLRMGSLAEAEASLKEAVRLDPFYDAALGNLGLLYASSGRNQLAQSAFVEALRIAPNSPVALSNLARFRFNAGDYDGAIELLTKLTALRPASAEAHTDLAHAYFLQDDVENARRAAQRALAIDPQYGRAQQILDAL